MEVKIQDGANIQNGGQYARLRLVYKMEAIVCNMEANIQD